MTLPPEAMPDRALVLDPRLIERMYAERAAAGGWPHDEVWYGMLVLLPLSDNDHQRIKSWLCYAFRQAGFDEGVYPGVNVSDRAADWLTNFRCPDFCVFLPGTAAVNHGTHFQGGPDFLIEILSRGERPDDKFDFYAAVGTREVMLIHRGPRAVELYSLRDGRLVLTGRSDEANPGSVASSVLPLEFRCVPGSAVPVVELTHTGTGQSWTAWPD
jgi:Uma2 family endonuclease